MILSATADLLADAASDVILIHTQRRIEALVASTGRPLWPRPVACANEPTLIGSDESRHIFATPHQIFALRRVDGRLAWQYGDRPPDDPGVDPEALTEWADHAMTGERLVARSNRDELICLDLPDGNLRWRREGSGVEAGRLVMDRRRVCTIRRRENRRSLCVADASTGETIHTIGLDGDTPCQALVPAADGALLVLWSRTMICVDPDAGAIRWRVRTSGRFVASTLVTSDEGVFISDDGLHVTKHDPGTGIAQWQTPPIGTPEGAGGLWVHLAPGRLLTAASGVLVASDPVDGRVLWVAHDPPGSPAQPPVVVGDAVVTLEIAKDAGTTRPVENLSADAPPPGSRRYRIRRFDLSDGRERQVVEDGELLTPPLGAAARMSARRNVLAILDGQRLIGYVDCAPR